MYRCLWISVSDDGGECHDGYEPHLSLSWLQLRQQFYLPKNVGVGRTGKGIKTRQRSISSPCSTYNPTYAWLNLSAAAAAWDASNSLMTWSDERERDREERSIRHHYKNPSDNLHSHPLLSSGLTICSSSKLYAGGNDACPEHTHRDWLWSSTTRMYKATSDSHDHHHCNFRLDKCASSKCLPLHLAVTVDWMASYQPIPWTECTVRLDNEPSRPKMGDAVMTKGAKRSRELPPLFTQRARFLVRRTQVPIP